MTYIGNHLMQDDRGYWFVDETEANLCGPFPTKEHATAGQIKYCLDCLGNYPEDQEKRMLEQLVKLPDITNIKVGWE